MNKIYKRIALASGIMLLTVFLCACGRKAEYNVLLITLDTTRADHLRCYGYKNVETPALNSLAREGVMFVRAYAHTPMTLPAHVSILSGTLPLYNGVLENVGYQVPDNLILLSEVLKENGWTTAGFVSAAVLKKDFHINQGFDYWNQEGIQPQPEMQALMAERKADAVTDAVLKWLESNGQKRWFIWVHYFDPHKEYAPPDPYRRLYYFDPYAGEIAFMDSQILRLFDYLKQKKLYDKTIIIAIGDHGESLGEHNEPTHYIFLYDATQWIPFLVRVPGLKKPGRAILNIVSQIDVFPTVLDLLNIKIPAQSQGRSLKKLLYGREPNELSGEAFLESHFPYLHFGWSELYGLVKDHYKYIQAPKPELYDLSWDPNELNDIAEKNPKLVKEFDERLEQIKAQSRSKLAEQASARGRQDGETIAQLKSLGYIVNQNTPDSAKAKQKNPRDYAELLAVINDALNAQYLGKSKELLSKAEQILAKDPENPVAIQLKSNALFAMGEHKKNIEWIQQSLSRTGETGELYAQLGFSYLQLNQLKSAESAFEKAVKLDPWNNVTRYHLARIYLSQGRSEDAIKLMEGSNLKEQAAGHLIMALYYLAQGRPGRAEVEFDLSMKMAPNTAIIKLEYGYYLLTKGDARKALELFLDAEKLDPSLKKDTNLQKAKEKARAMIEKGT